LTFDHLNYIHGLLDKVNSSELPVVTYSKRPIGKSILKNKLVKGNNKIRGLDAMCVGIDDMIRWEYKNEQKTTI
jgi:hypothetical protein